MKIILIVTSPSLEQTVQQDFAERKMTHRLAEAW